MNYGIPPRPFPYRVPASGSVILCFPTSYGRAATPTAFDATSTGAAVDQVVMWIPREMRKPHYQHQPAR